MIANIIASRRAVYPAQYNQEFITQEEIQQLLNAANWAPTHRRTEPWRFKVFHSEEARNQLSKFLAKTYQETAANFSEVKYQKTAEKPLQSGCVIAICMQRDEKESVPEWEEIAATAMAVQNMWLLATDLKIGAYWSSPSYLKYFNELVPLGDSEQCIGLFYMGKFDGDLQDGTRNTSISEKTVWV